MKLGTKARYAVMAMVDLAANSGGKPVALAQIAERQEISLSYLEQIFGRLRAHGLVTSVRGPGGGYLLGARAEDTPISNIVVAVDDNLQAPSQGRKLEGNGRLPTDDLWEELDNQIHSYLRSVSLDDVISKRVLGMGRQGGLVSIVRQPGGLIMREIVSDVFIWHKFSEPHGYNFNGYLIRHGEEYICIDPVDPSEEDLQELTHLGLSRILVTNRNHTRAANVLRERTGAKTSIHPADAPHARNQGATIDDEFNAGDRIEPFVVVGVPGKSPGEVAFYWPERHILFVGDAVIGDPPGQCRLLGEEVIDDPARLQNSVRKLMTYDIDILLVGDGEPIIQSAHERLGELVDSFSN